MRDLLVHDVFIARQVVPRRDEEIAIGMDRLGAAVSASAGPLSDVLEQLLAAFAPDGAEDDIAVLAFRWLDEAGHG